LQENKKKNLKREHLSFLRFCFFGGKTRWRERVFLGGGEKKKRQGRGLPTTEETGGEKKIQKTNREEGKWNRGGPQRKKKGGLFQGASWSGRRPKKIDIPQPKHMPKILGTEKKDWGARFKRKNKTNRGPEDVKKGKARPPRGWKKEPIQSLKNGPVKRKTGKGGGLLCAGSLFEAQHRIERKDCNLKREKGFVQSVKGLRTNLQELNRFRRTTQKKLFALLG